MASPNIILIICDQMRGDCWGGGGHPVAETPNLDALAARGTTFRHAYTEVPSCLPARACLWSGQTAWHAGLVGMGPGQGPVPNDFPHTLAGELTRAGYRTHMVGKGHFTPQRTLMGFESTELDESGRMLMQAGLADDYRAWFAANAPAGITPDDHGVDWNSWISRAWHTHEYLHPTAWTMTRAIQFLSDRDPDRPFFLNISFARPHSPYVPPQPYLDLYRDCEIPAPVVGDWAAVHDDPVTAKDPNAWRGRMSPARVRRARMGYLGEISFIDTQVGRLINWMSRFAPAALRDTWFVFVSDHGDMQGDHHLWRKTHAYEGSAHIPFFVVPPFSAGIRSRASADEPVVLRDVMPTLLEVAGVPIPATVEGCSVLPALSAPVAGWRTHVHGEHCPCYADHEMQYVTDGRRKYIWFPRTGQEQFFDLESDPGETRDLIAAGERGDEVSLWRQRLVEELDCGLVGNGRLSRISGTIISPWRDRRWPGVECD
jgi:arylsulfatase A-like enzyme